MCVSIKRTERGTMETTIALQRSMVSELSKHGQKDILALISPGRISRLLGEIVESTVTRS